MELPSQWGLFAGTAIAGLTAAATFVVGEVMTVRQSNLKRLLASSTLAHIGAIALLLSVGTVAATAAALAHLLNTVVIEALLFLAVAGCSLRTGSPRIDALKGIGKAMPFTGACLAVGLVSVMGLPPTGAFWSTLLMLHAAVSAGDLWIAVVLLAGSLVGCVAYARCLTVLFFSPYTDEPVRELPWSVRAVLGLLAAAVVVAGVLPQAWIGLVVPPALALLPHAKDVLPPLTVPWALPTLLPLAGAAAAMRFRKKRITAGMLAALSLVLALMALAAESGTWGTFQLAFAGLALATGLGNIVYATGFMAHSRASWRFLAVFLTMIAGLVGMTSAQSLLAFYCFWEMTHTWPLFFASIHEERPAALKGGTKHFLFNLTSAAVLLVGILLLGAMAGGYGFAEVSRALAEQPAGRWMFAMGLVVLGLLLKAAMLPVGIDWQMYPATPASGYLSAMVLKSAPFGLLLFRFVLARDVAPASAHALDLLLTAGAWIGGATLLYAGIRALMQTGIKEMLIFSTVSQLGYIILGLCLATPLGVAGGLLHLFNHMLFKNLAVLCAGALIESTGAHSLNALGGIGRKMPFTLLAFACALFSAVGMPLFNGFTSKYLLYQALLARGEVTLAVIAIFTSVVTLASFLKFLHTAFFGQLSPVAAQGKDPGLFMRIPMLTLSGLCLLTGLFPGIGLIPIAAIERTFGLIPPAVGLSGVLSGPGTLDATLLGFMLLATGGAVWLVSSRFLRTPRRTAIHTCGELVDPATTQVGPSNLFPLPLHFVSRPAWGFFSTSRPGGRHD